MSKTYKLTALADVFNNVPADKIEKCMGEIARGMIQARALRDLLDATSQELGGGSVGLVWPETCEWIDDDKGITTIGVGDKDGQHLTMETRPA